MGLSISTHFLADMLENDEEGAEWIQESIALVNELLVQNDLPQHVEPTTATTLLRAHTSSFPYSFLHYLRRAFAHVHQGTKLTPAPENYDPSKDLVVDRASSMFDAHLLCHSDAEGYYVPVDFDEVIFDLDERGLAGGSLGSTQRLMAELVRTAPAIRISLDDGKLSDAKAEAINNDTEADPYYRERAGALRSRASVARRQDDDRLQLSCSVGNRDLISGRHVPWRCSTFHRTRRSMRHLRCSGALARAVQSSKVSIA
jgi:hypothetical protein